MCRAHQRLGVDRGHPVGLGVDADDGECAGPGLRAGGESVDRDLPHTEALREIAEGGVTGDDVLALAGGQTRRELLRERGQLVLEGPGIPFEVGAVGGVHPREPMGDRLGDLGVALRVQPEVRIGGAGSEAQVELGRRRDVEGAGAGLGLDGLVDGALQALLEDHEPGPADGRHVPGCELDVVWLGTRPGQAGDRHEVAADLLGGVLKGVERGDDGELAAHRAV